MNDPFWMIEKNIGGNAHWWVRAPNQYDFWDHPSRWTTDVNLARQYKTKSDADYVIGRDMVGCVATEHGWMQIQREDAPQDIKEAV